MKWSKSLLELKKTPKLKYNLKNTCSIKFYLKTKKCNENYQPKESKASTDPSIALILSTHMCSSVCHPVFHLR